MWLLLAGILLVLSVYLFREVKKLRAPKEGSSRLRRWARAALAVLISLILLQHACLLFSLLRLKERDPSTTAMMEQRSSEAEERGVTPKVDRTWVPYESLSPNLLRAAIAGEDPRFYSHSGVDWKEVRRAFELNLQEGRIVRGASTITQQVVKNLFLSTSKNPLRKLHEMLLAWEAERALGKRRVMEIYLNVAEWGDGVYGAEAAARHYFKTSAASLTKEQAAFLVAILPRPRHAHDPQNLPPNLQDQVRVIQENMHDVVLQDDSARQR